ncbi:MAG: hypothetical protein GY927_24050 [bacterium]|nr:hypothetical protein [bacterium]
MLKKSIMGLAIAAIATISMGEAASAKSWKWGVGWGGHHHSHHYIKTFTPSYFVHSCHYYKKKWHATGYKSWKKKYQACLVLKDD